MANIPIIQDNHKDIAQNVEHLTKHIKNMQEDITDMNKMNPLRKIF